MRVSNAVAMGPINRFHKVTKPTFLKEVKQNRIPNLPGMRVEKARVIFVVLLWKNDRKNIHSCLEQLFNWTRCLAGSIYLMGFKTIHAFQCI